MRKERNETWRAWKLMQRRCSATFRAFFFQNTQDEHLIAGETWGELCEFNVRSRLYLYNRRVVCYTGLIIMTSSDRSIFRVTGPLCGEVTGEFPSQRPVTRSFDVFFDLSWITGWVNNREAGDLRRHRAHYDVIAMSRFAPSQWETVLLCNDVSLIGAGLILGLRPANERRRYFVTTSLIGWAQAENQPCNSVSWFPVW